MDQLQNNKFHRTDRGASLQTLKVASWNVGGLSAQQALELTHHFAGDEALESLQVLLLQEVITEEGRHAGGPTRRRRSTERHEPWA